MRKVMRRAAVQLALVGALTVAPFALAAQAQAAERPATTGCGSVVTTQYIYFSGISSEPVASLKLMSGGCAYLWMWSWFTASHSGWTVGLTTCPSSISGGYQVYPVSNGSVAVGEGCASPYVWRNTVQQEFYGPAGGYNCEYAAAELIYNSYDAIAATQPYCFA